MSVLTTYTIACDKKLSDKLQCPRVIGPHASIWAAEEEAEAAGWDLARRRYRPEGDRCKDHKNSAEEK